MENDMIDVGEMLNRQINGLLPDGLLSQNDQLLLAALYDATNTKTVIISANNIDLANYINDQLMEAAGKYWYVAKYNRGSWPVHSKSGVGHIIIILDLDQDDDICIIEPWPL